MRFRGGLVEDIRHSIHELKHFILNQVVYHFGDDCRLRDGTPVVLDPNSLWTRIMYQINILIPGENFALLRH
jgi:hypothetical protein